MIPPKHLWSGDWRAEAEERRRREAAASAPAGDAAAATTDDPAPESPPPPATRAPRRGRTVAAIAAVALLAGAGGGVIAHELDGGQDGDPGVFRPAALPAVGSRAAVHPREGQTQVGAIYAAASPAVVSILTTQGSGTGFLIDPDGTLVTNDHVVDTAKTVKVRFGTEGAVLTGTVRGTDPSSDLAVVHIDPSGIPKGVKPLTFADSSKVAVGDTTIAIGNPFGLDRTATEGIVSSLGRQIQAPNQYQIDDVIQTDAAINPGNSGGPLLDVNGNVIGVNSQIATSGTSSGNVGIGFAIPSNTVRRIEPGIAQGRRAIHAWLGVESSSPVSAVATSTGVLIHSVVPGGPADLAGLQAGDTITAIDGRTLAASSDLSTAINNQSVGDHVTLTVERDGQERKLKATLQLQPVKGTSSLIP
jgi:putative serine protease PepD